MDKAAILLLFNEAIAEKNIHLKLGKSKSYLSHLRNDKTPKLGTMLELLFILDKIKITTNDSSGKTT